MDYQGSTSDDADVIGPENEISLKVAELVTKMIIDGSLPGETGPSRDPDAAIDGVLLALALVLEQAPESRTPRALRQQCDAFAKRLHYHASLCRGAFEREGVHPIAHVVEGFGTPPGGSVN